jgi:two-component system phosphate regulon sensor histidine kinase PhoR
MWPFNRTPDAQDLVPALAPEIRLADAADVIHALSEPALIVDGQGMVRLANRAAAEVLEVDPAGLHLSASIRIPAVLEAVAAATAGEDRVSVDYELRGSILRVFRAQVSGLGAGRGALVVLRDLTREQQIERMRADFVANASHELRTPLASLTLLIETIAGPARENAEERDRFLGMMQVQADRMRRLIADLLSLSRIELDEHVPPSDRADLAAVAREVVDALNPFARERGVRIELAAPAKGLGVVGERFQLAQVVQNLIDNAIKYTPKDGVVRVEIARGGDREETAQAAGRRWDEAGRAALLTPAAVANRSYAYVRVEDCGPGIDRHFLPRLGERFFRVERELGNERGGTGLGLAIVKHIVNRHRGGLLVESQQGKGSAFAAYVQLAEED